MEDGTKGTYADAELVVKHALIHFHLFLPPFIYFRYL